MDKYSDRLRLLPGTQEGELIMDNDQDKAMPDEQHTEDLGNGKIRIHYRFGDKEMDAEGKPEDINRYVAFFLSDVIRENGSAMTLLNDDTPLLDKSNSVPTQNLRAEDDGRPTYQLSDL